MCLKTWIHTIHSQTIVDKIDFDRVDNIDLLVIAIKENYDPREVKDINEKGYVLPRDLRYAGIFRDLPLLREAGLSAATGDAVPEVQEAADYVAGRDGGKGAVREFIDFIRSIRKHTV